ncbi:molecular chaperone [Aliikangiella sp. G2MR2-5]|uniref:molecular chaperone n=1 Tax=Aliikangiella sp. G2MR2-5 TaxID=2788943 RepID=UPI0018A94876|nr:molecular chaperone [Aliikangiella sp. G2MR2-5]
MYAGLDYGTSSSAIGIIEEELPKLLPIQAHEPFLPSTLYTLDRSFVCEYLAKSLPEHSRDHYIGQRKQQLLKASAFRRSFDMESDEVAQFFGQRAIEEYIEYPEEGLFIKSPKSFLGSTGLNQSQLSFFEDLVTAMLLYIKQNAEVHTQQKITRVVIGRPVNFQGVSSSESNRQAIDIMTLAAKRCGYQEIEFLYEPLAAGVDFETGLNQDMLVLVVDIGGGTTDCSMVKMGPSYVKKDVREEDFLAHTGSRTGGNDLDIATAYHQFMPLFGLGSMQTKGIEMPAAPFWSAVSINNVGEQAKFASDSFARELKALRRDAQRVELLDRLIHLQANKLNHRLVRSAELTKIALSDKPKVRTELEYVESDLELNISEDDFKRAINRPAQQIQSLISEAVKQAQTKPDVIYITGGSAKSPTVRKVVNQVLPGVDILDGDYYGSVAAGLTKWAHRIWR